VPSFSYTSLLLCLFCLPFALASVKTTTNFALDAGVLGLVIRVGEALNLNIKALLKAGDSLFEASDYRVSLQAY
jgi:hypothetical protein